MLNTSRSTPPTAALTLLTLALLAAAPVPTALAQNQLWIQQFGTREIDRAYSLASDGAGGVLIAGETWGSLGGPNAGSSDVFLARFDSDGNQVWLRQFGTNEFDYVYALAPDAAGGVIAAGYTGGSLGTSNPGNSDAVLTRFDGAGNQLWVRQFGTGFWNEIWALAPDGVGGVMAGGFSEGASGGPGAGSRDAWVARYDSAGNQVWTRHLSTSNADWASALMTDGTGGAVVAGSTYGSLNGPNAGGMDVFLAHYDGEGNPSWIRQFGTSDYDFVRGIAPDGVGGVMIAGDTRGSLGGPNAGGWDAFLARYDRKGNRLWIRQFGTNGWDQARAVAPDGAGGVMVAGRTSGNLGGPNTSLGEDAWIARYDSAGNRLWIRQFGTSGSDGTLALLPDGARTVMVAGFVGGILGGSTAGPADAFLARYTIDSCYADCDQVSGVGVLDMLDFLCWQDDFVAGNSYACDCDTSTGLLVCDIFDFLCFQNAFVAGCP